MNRPEQAPFTVLRADYVHPPNAREANVVENGMGKNPVWAKSTRLTGKRAQNTPGQKIISEKRGVR